MLHHRWPLLDDRQDPQGLPARVAFNLHKLGLTATALQGLAGITRAHARRLRQGSLPLREGDVQWLHAALGLDDELVRELSELESLEWAFYRVSARYPVDVWRNAHAAWAPFLSLRDAAHLIGVPSQSLSGLVAGTRRHPILTRPPAETLADALGLEQGPETFIGGLVPSRD